MQQKDQNTLTMWNVVSRYLANKNTVWKDNRPYSSATAELNEAIEDAGKALQGQMGTSTGLTEDKDRLEIIAVDQVVAIAKSTKVYALDNHDSDLKAKVDFSKTDLLRLPEPEKVQRLKSMVTAAQEVGEKLKDYGVEEAACPDALRAVEDYEQASPNPRGAIADKSVITASIPGILKRGRMALEKLDNLSHIFDAKDPSFAAGYKAARVVVTTGHRHNPDAPDTKE